MGFMVLISQLHDSYGEIIWLVKFSIINESAKQMPMEYIKCICVFNFYLGVFLCDAAVI